ncbi:MAG: acyl-CoA desaturase [Acidobacteriota bacterium]|nr:acyl-CoA desaturase [Acidobacteriota bacterium]
MAPDNLTTTLTESMDPPNTEHLAETQQHTDWSTNIPFLGIHLGCLLILWTGIDLFSAGVGLITLLLRMFGLTGGYHRYFCHRSFKTTRIFQFVLAVLGVAAAQKGPLWWAGHHRHHHRHSDTASDVHPPGVKGFYWAHFGWVICPANLRTRTELVPDLVRFPELRWLNRHHYTIPACLAAGLFVLGSWLEATSPYLGASGWKLLAVGFFLSTTLLYHVTFAVNSIGHTVGRQRYDTRDASRNGLLLALITAGEGWHNNHHRYPASERQGFYWWEIDATHYVVALLARFHIVWDVRSPSSAVLDEGRQ